MNAMMNRSSLKLIAPIIGQRNADLGQSLRQNKCSALRVKGAATSPNAGGTYNVTETFISGRFTTVAGPSPDACDPTGVKGSTIADGVTGSFSGNFLIVVSNGKFDPTATCDSGCDTTAGFVVTVYGPAATYDIPSFGFTYHANGPDLVQREWHNASAGQGGNGGDIRSS